MKKIILMTALATAVLTANAQDIKPYEEKMSQIEAQYKSLESAYHNGKLCFFMRLRPFYM